MLTPDFSFVHTVTVERWKERGISGDVFDAPTTIKCRVNLKHARTRDSKGDTVKASAATVFMPSDTQISEHDRITFNSVIYEVIAVLNAYNLDGTINHIEVEIA